MSAGTPILCNAVDRRALVVTCQHEAGHGVAAVNQRRRIHEIKVLRTPNGGWHGYLSRSDKTIARTPSEIRESTIVSPTVESYRAHESTLGEILRDESRYWLGGMAAQDEFSADAWVSPAVWLGGAVDRAQLESSLAFYGIDLDLGVQLKVARDYIDSRWGAVVAVRDALVAMVLDGRESMSGDEVRALVAAAPAAINHCRSRC